MKKENDNKAIDDLLNKLEVKPHREDLASSIINEAAQIKQQKSFIYYLQDVIEGLSDNFYLPSPRFSMDMFILVGFLSGVFVSDLSIGPLNNYNYKRNWECGGREKITIN